MQDSNPFTPPSAEVKDVIQPGVPVVFKAMLSLYLVLTIAGNLVSGHFNWLVLPVIMVIAARSMFKGSAAASRYLGVLFVIGLVFNALAVWGALARHDVIGAIPTAIFAVYTGVLAAYIFFSPALQAHFVAGAKARWAGN